MSCESVGCDTWNAFRISVAHISPLDSMLIIFRRLGSARTLSCFAIFAKLIFFMYINIEMFLYIGSVKSKNRGLKVFLAGLRSENHAIACVVISAWMKIVYIYCYEI